MKTIFVTAFDPFGGEAINPSWEAIKPLQGSQVFGANIETCQLPCIFDTSLEHLYAAIDKYQPELVISVGQAGGRTNITVERVAININDARIPDNAGNQPIDTPVIVDGPAAYFSRLPIKTMVNALNTAGIPASVSQTAGTFVCNHVMYGLLHYLAQNAPSVRGGFIHVPYLPEQAAKYANQPSMTLELMTLALKTAIETAWRNTSDIAVTGGATH
ncbi:pyroglutamyl-peptidase I [Xenorhabdus bovienii]|uniref:Pyrrolidone-carboxylate peptidase n=1 Tax=Xenorhabdus bovienii TaxID=40576 RepID=A0AAJ1JFW1_XENBV|nr:pyroglutamyl-peptidase I [Xenorhabdus bovienii]MDE1480303.1 pyroglutamyl-peptidase I [Xenorhabdus bovienii]MDE1492622.1 pyroglutamyl-peptidase I [Xenorhabdus bovienii]MDE1495265.1 pyroglutamyl-peptidase I [Xenorhabdus bovienii]MDE9473348.1 pyroglutamyl-peptidase I [Xenorhabdus bovienii]MDE9511973.1 pyroglutamyl-peptidase I [Xenorhabdus bovienii]